MLTSFQQTTLTIEKFIPINITFLSKLKNVKFIDLISSLCKGEFITGGCHGLPLKKCFIVQEKKQQYSELSSRNILINHLIKYGRGSEKLLVRQFRLYESLIENHYFLFVIFQLFHLHHSKNQQLLL